MTEVAWRSETRPVELRPSVNIEWGDVTVDVDQPDGSFVIKVRRDDPATLEVHVEKTGGDEREGAT